MYCLKHAQKYANKPNIADFRVERTVFVDREGDDGKRKCRPVDCRTVKFSLGGLVIDRMGVIVEQSDSKQVNKSYIPTYLCIFFPYSWL